MRNKTKIYYKMILLNLLKLKKFRKISIKQIYRNFNCSEKRENYISQSHKIFWLVDNKVYNQIVIVE